MALFVLQSLKQGLFDFLTNSQMVPGLKSMKPVSLLTDHFYSIFVCVCLLSLRQLESTVYSKFELLYMYVYYASLDSHLAHFIKNCFF